MPGNDWLVFNLNDDPYEQANLAFDDVYKTQRARLHAMLADWLERTNDQFALPAV